MKFLNRFNHYSFILGLALAVFFHYLSIDSPLSKGLLPFFGLVGILGSILFLPEYLNSKANSSKWYISGEFISIIIINLIALVGFIVPNMTIGFSLALFILSIILFFKSLKINGINLIEFIGTIAIILFLSLMIQSVYYNPNIYKMILSGNIHIDLMMHTSLCNSLTTNTNLSMLLDGKTTFVYHWLSHGLLGGYKNLLHWNALNMYVYGYTIIFIPIFIKSFLYACNRFSELNKEFYLLILALIAFYFSLDKFIYLGQPIASESYCISLIFSLLALCIIFQMRNEKITFFEYLNLSIIILMVCFTKISTGLVLMSGLWFLSIKKNRTWINFFLTSLLCLVCLIISIKYLYLSDKSSESDTLLHRYEAMWVHSQSFIDYLMGLWIFIAVFIWNNKSDNFKNILSILSSNKYLLFEALAFMTLVGYAGGIYVSSHTNDVIYFSGIQLYLSLPILFYGIYLLYDKMSLNEKGKYYLSFGIIILSIMAKPEVGKSILNYQKYSSIDIEKYSTYDQFLKKIIELDGYNHKEDLCIYIDKNEKWFKNSQLPDINFYERSLLEKYTIIPSISGIAVISGIEQEALDGPYMYNGIFFHKKHRNKEASNLEEAIRNAKSDGYKTMFYFTGDSNLKMKKIKL